MTWPEGSEDPEGKASERNPDVMRSAHGVFIVHDWLNDALQNRDSLMTS